MIPENQDSSKCDCETTAKSVKETIKTLSFGSDKIKQLLAKLDKDEDHSR